MHRLRILAAFAVMIVVTFVSLAGEPSSLQELSPRPVQFSADELSFQSAMKELEKQTGNAVGDRRSDRTNPKLLFPNKTGAFWPMMDQIGKQTGIGFSAYQPDGGVAWVDAPYRSLKTHYGGLFRFAVKRVAIVRDDETQTHVCTVAVDVAWEPRLQPFFSNLEEAEVSFKDRAGAKKSERLERQTTSSISGICATELDLRFQAPDRSTAKLDSLKGTLRVIGPPRMLQFAFAALKPKTVEQEGVKVSVMELKKEPKRWSVDLLIENPKDAIVRLESFQNQSWMDNNRVWLEWTDPKTKAVRKLEPSAGPPREDSKGTKIAFHFTPQEKTPLPPNINEVVLYCRTPNRVVAFTVPFEFKDLPLP